MIASAATNTSPGVYIEQGRMPRPITGVATSITAFIGPAERGPFNTPTFLTDFAHCEDAFGSTMTAPMVYVTHAVRGFFENGGAACYFVRVGTARDDITQLQARHYHEAIDALEQVGDVNLLCVPDRTDEEVQKHLIRHCEMMQDRFAILDPLPGAGLSNGIVKQRGGLSSESGYAALYYPWIYVANPVGRGRLKVPPSGHIAGIYARTDRTRGVHKAPADEAIRSAFAIERMLSDHEQGPLNERGVNVLRWFPGRGVVVWGARTIAPPDRTEWRYVNVRRLLLFLEQSIREGTKFALSESNTPELRQAVKQQVTDFLTRVWREGALFGATPDRAFRVRIDDSLNPPSVRALGQLVIEVAVSPLIPAEPITFRIIQQPGGPVVKE